MVLVDSSVWIDLLRERATNVVAALQRLLDRERAALTPVIYQEILQGASSQPHFERLRDYFSAQPFLLPVHPIRTHEQAANLYARCRWRGMTPRSLADCLVAQVAIEQDVQLLAHDRDFDWIAKAEPRLKLFAA